MFQTCNLVPLFLPSITYSIPQRTFLITVNSRNANEVREDGPVADLHFGSSPVSGFVEPMLYFPFNQRPRWLVHLLHVSFAEDVVFDGPLVAELVTATQFMVVNDRYLAGFTRVFGEMRHEGAHRYIDCNRIPTLPDLVFHYTAGELTLTGEQYIGRPFLHARNLWNEVLASGARGIFLAPKPDQKVEVATSDGDSSSKASCCLAFQCINVEYKTRPGGSEMKECYSTADGRLLYKRYTYTCSHEVQTNIRKNSYRDVCCNVLGL
ncbi:hypothetical protein CLF_112082 [Clonorchis sinensis]|uniref:Uncharacterized protein n=1 Tax=Clonorchis sinensis TaxID=79923 RepID=G7YVT6_CLOSI|nr:hypothetical protein CLF_112082 [Clonorchis sinensis]